MIPQNVKDLLSGEQYTGLFQIIALAVFMMFFIALIFYVFSRPKKHYEEEANLPLNDSSKINLND